MKRTFRILRYDPESEKKEHFESFTVETNDDATVLSALIDIRETQDPTLSMRYSCRQAQCGSCSMKVNGRPQLACQALVKNLKGTVTIEPLPNMPVLKDLVVSLKRFFGDFREVKPFLQPTAPAPGNKEYRQSPHERERIAKVSDCIMCGCCQGGCPVLEKTSTQFKGPAIMVQAMRFIGDSRDGATEERIQSVNTESGIGSCDQFGICSRVCPKGISPSLTIRKLRNRSGLKIMRPNQFTMKVGIRDVVTALFVVFACVALVRNWSGPAVFNLAIAAATCVIIDYIINGLRTRIWYFSEPALISGLIIGLVLTRSAPWYTVVVAGAVAMLSKHFIRFSRKHIFNPATLGLVAVGIVFGTFYDWWGEQAGFFVLLIGGLIIVYLLDYWALVVSFLVTLAMTSAVGIVILGFPLTLPDVYSEMLASAPLFFTFFMLTEPITSPTSKKQQIVFGIVVGVLRFSFQWIPGMTSYALLAALLCGNLLAAYFRFRENSTSEEDELLSGAQ